MKANRIQWKENWSNILGNYYYQNSTDSKKKDKTEKFIKCPKQEKESTNNIEKNDKVTTGDNGDGSSELNFLELGEKTLLQHILGNQFDDYILINDDLKDVNKCDFVGGCDFTVVSNATTAYEDLSEIKLTAEDFNYVPDEENAFFDEYDISDVFSADKSEKVSIKEYDYNMDEGAIEYQHYDIKEAEEEKNDSVVLNDINDNQGKVFKNKNIKVESTNAMDPFEILGKMCSAHEESKKQEKSSIRTKSGTKSGKTTKNSKNGKTVKSTKNSRPNKPD